MNKNLGLLILFFILLIGFYNKFDKEKKYKYEIESKILKYKINELENRMNRDLYIKDSIINSNNNYINYLKRKNAHFNKLIYSAKETLKHEKENYYSYNDSIKLYIFDSVSSKRYNNESIN